MFVFGGWDGNDTINSITTYSFVSNYWYEEVVLSIKPTARYRHASTIIGNSMFIFGGVDKNSTRFDDLLEYNFDKREWKIIETGGQVPTPRTFH